MGNADSSKSIEHGCTKSVPPHSWLQVHRLTCRQAIIFLHDCRNSIERNFEKFDFNINDDAQRLWEESRRAELADTFDLDDKDYQRHTGLRAVSIRAAKSRNSTGPRHCYGSEEPMLSVSKLIVCRLLRISGKPQQNCTPGTCTRWVKRRDPRAARLPTVSKQTRD